MPCGINSIVASPPPPTASPQGQADARRPILLAVSRATSNNIELWNMGHDGQDIFLERVKFYFIPVFISVFIY